MKLTKEKPKGHDHPIVPHIIRAISKANVWIYKLSGGALGGEFKVGAAALKPAPALLLTTRGRKSGKKRIAPLLYLEDGNNVVIVASQGGLPKNPQWYLNLQHDPHVEIQIKRDKRQMIARTANPAERAALWPRLVDLYADYDNYQSWTTREIPVVILEPSSN